LASGSHLPAHGKIGQAGSIRVEPPRLAELWCPSGMRAANDAATGWTGPTWHLRHGLGGARIIVTVTGSHFKPMVRLPTPELGYPAAGSRVSLQLRHETYPAYWRCRLVHGRSVSGWDQPSRPAISLSTSREGGTCSCKR
jgi:hypothetical protein